ncbi:hypothetical protein K438DRAFT_1783096 [Mycena galopus ATCC 62051]|nr:hypothetical protein K438DRAFT_1783096 [Mycena galopus ATCC 62051]
MSKATDTTGNLTKDKEEMAARAPQAAISGHLASAASAMQPSLRRGEGGVWQHSAYRMRSNGIQWWTRTSSTRGEDDAGSPPPQRLATATQHRSPHSVYEEETLSRLDRARGLLSTAKSVKFFVPPKWKMRRTGRQRGNAKEIRSSLAALRDPNPNMGCNGRSAAGGCALSNKASPPGFKIRTRKEGGNRTEHAGKNTHWQYGCNVACVFPMNKGSPAPRMILSGSRARAYRHEFPARRGQQ